MSIKSKKFFFILLFSLCFIIFSKADTLANEANKNSEKSSEIKYQLAYPGILPDNKFYIFKAIRDKIIERLITNPVKKIEYDLLMADKTIYASQLLADKGNIPLAKKTVLKGEHYFTILVTDYKWAYWKHEKIPVELNSKIKLASKQHQKVFKSIAQKLNYEDRKVFEEVIKFSQRNTSELESFNRNEKK